MLTFAFAFPDIDNGLGQVEFAAAGILQMYLQDRGGVCDEVAGTESVPVNNDQGDERGEFAENSDGILPNQGIDIQLLQYVGQGRSPVFAGFQMKRDVFGGELLYCLGVEFSEDLGVDPVV